MRCYENIPQRPIISFPVVNLVSRQKKASVVHLKFRKDERERSGTAEHLCVFQDECTECIYVPGNTGKLAEYRTCKAVNPGKKGPDIIECFKKWVESDLVDE